MKISAKDRLYGHPALKVRQVLREGSSYGVTVALAASVLKADDGEALELVAALQADGYLTPAKQTRGGPLRWELSVKGAALSMARAAPPIKRKAAEEMLLAFLDRVEKVRDSDEFPIKVRSIVLFGSFLSDAAELGDIDLAIDFRPVFADRDEQKAAEDRCRDRAEAAGRRFPDFLARLSWPDMEVRRFLRDRRPFSFHDARDDGPVIDAGPHVTIYADEVVVEAIPLLGGWGTRNARLARELAQAKREIVARKRVEAEQRKRLKEQAEMKAALERVMAMSPEERAKHQDEINALVVDVQRRLNSRRRRAGNSEET